MTQETLDQSADTRKDRETINRLLDCSNDAYQIHIRLEDEFQQTLGLARALEAMPNDPELVRKIVRLIRADYRKIKRAFAEIDERSDARRRAQARLEASPCH